MQSRSFHRLFEKNELSSVSFAFKLSLNHLMLELWVRYITQRTLCERYNVTSLGLSLGWDETRLGCWAWQMVNK